MLSRNLVFALFLGTAVSVHADIEFISSDTTVQVLSVAGTARDSGVTTTLSDGSFQNEVGVSVNQNQAGDGAGTSFATISVDPSIPLEPFAQMQVAASILPADGEAFAEAKVVYFFEKPSTVFVERRINQGDTRFFLDSVQTALTSTITRFEVLQGLHSFEIEVVTGEDVVNPNFSVIIEAREDDSDGGTGGTPDDDDTEGNLSSIASRIAGIKSKVTASNKAGQKEIKSDLKALLEALKVNINELGLPESDLQEALSKFNALNSAFKKFRKAKSAPDIKRAKKALNKALRQLRDALGL